MGRTVYLPTWMVDVYGKCRYKYTASPMDASWDPCPKQPRFHNPNDFAFSQVTIQISFIDIEEALNILCQTDGLTVIFTPNG